MHKEIQHYLSHIIPLLEQRGIQISEQKEIAYGLQLKVQRADQRANINLYYSEKRGLSQVVGAPKGSGLKDELQMLLMGEAPSSTDAGFHLWYAWIGSDECGKGDYFGPLIVTAFFCTREQLPELAKIGVQDSKKLSDSSICTVAKQVYTRFPGQQSSLILKPTKYNELIAGFKQQGRNLNDLLAWTHHKVISDLLERDFSAEGVIIDQFSKAQKAKARLSPGNPDLQIIERTGAERDLAVAAASILSRYQFLEARAQLDRRFAMRLPLGAGPGVIKAGKEFVQKYGRERLAEVAKIHFKTTQSL